MMPDRPATPAEQKALDKPWIVWASAAVIVFTLVSLVLGFLVLPQRDQGDEGLWAAVCRAIGISGAATGAAADDAPLSPVSDVAWTVDTRRLLREADVDRGAAVAQQVCVACHGEDGIGIDPTYPNLTHQSLQALYKQLMDYKSGRRRGGQADVMTSTVEPLSERELADAALYYAARDARRWVEAATAVAPEITRLARHGDAARAIASCNSCHGASRSGVEESPVLTGQSAAYLEEQLNLFASGERSNDLFGRMRTISRSLTADEIRGLAIYYGGKPSYR